MDDATKKTASSDFNGMNKREVLLVTAELEKRRYESQQQIDLLRNEKRKLEEIHKVLKDEMKEAESHLSSLRQQEEALDDEIGTLTSNNVHLDDEIEKCKLTITTLGANYSDYQKLDEQLSQKIVSAEKSIADTVRLIHQVADQLASSRSILERIKGKFSESK